MKDFLQKSTLKSHPSRVISLVLFIVIIIINIASLGKPLNKIITYKKLMPYQEIGYRHRGLDEFIPKGTKYVGYYTGQDLGYGKEAKYFAQAQYVLAPLILDYNNLEHKYIIFTCNEFLAWKVIRKIGASPLRKNKFGVILATRENLND